MIEALDWLTEHWDEIAAGAAALYTVATVVVALTPTPEDDAFLRRLAERLSFLSPPGAKGSAKLPGAKPKRDGE